MSEPAPWWQFWTDTFTAAGTVGAVVVALFGSWLRARLAAPRLEIEFGQEAERGILVPTDMRNTGAPNAFNRWYHLRVVNKRRDWAPAQNVRLLLLRFEEQDAAGRYTTRWTGEIPIQWSDSQIVPATPTIGPGYDADLCCVLKDRTGQQHQLALFPIVRPFHLPSVWSTNEIAQIPGGKLKFVIRIQARSDECDSDEYRVGIAWDGQWDDDTLKMTNHVVITPPAKIELKRRR